MSESLDYPGVEATTDLELGDWLNERHIGLGSTDAPVIAGVSKYKSPFALYHEKIKSVAAVGVRDVERLQWGRQLEPLIIDRYRKDTGRRAVISPSVAKGKYEILRSRTHPWMHATLDGVILEGRIVPIGKDGDDTYKPLPGKGVGVLEVKNVSSYIGERWKDEPPIEFIVQVQHQMAVTGANYGSIAALIGGNVFVWQDVPRDQEFIDIIVRLEMRFMERIRNLDPPDPDSHESTNELLKKLYPRDNGQLIHLGPDFLDIDGTLHKAKEEKKLLQGVIDECENKLKAAIGEATAAALPDGTVYTYKHTSRKGYTVQASEFRQLRRKAAAAPRAIGKGPGAALMLPEDQPVEEAVD